MWEHIKFKAHDLINRLFNCDLFLPPVMPYVLLIFVFPFGREHIINDAKRTGVNFFYPHGVFTIWIWQTIIVVAIIIVFKNNYVVYMIT